MIPVESLCHLMSVRHSHFLLNRPLQKRSFSFFQRRRCSSPHACDVDHRQKFKLEVVNAHRM